MEAAVSKLLFESSLETGRGAATHLRKNFDASSAETPSAFLLRCALFLRPEEEKAARAQLAGPRLSNAVLALALPMHEAALRRGPTMSAAAKDEGLIVLSTSFPPVLPLQSREAGGVGLANPSNLCYMNCELLCSVINNTHLPSTSTLAEHLFFIFCRCDLTALYDPLLPRWRPCHSGGARLHACRTRERLRAS
jgi:hypothetical protein